MVSWIFEFQSPAAIYSMVFGATVEFMFFLSTSKSNRINLTYLFESIPFKDSLFITNTNMYYYLDCKQGTNSTPHLSILT